MYGVFGVRTGIAFIAYQFIMHGMLIKDYLKIRIRFRQGSLTLQVVDWAAIVFGV